MRTRVLCTLLLCATSLKFSKPEFEKEEKEKEKDGSMQMGPGVVPLGLLKGTLLANKMFFLHIPKAAGTSFAVDRRDVQSAEGCYEWSEKLKSNGTLLMLRRPTDHVLSMYNHCKSGPYGPQWAHEKMPETFEEWVRKWTDIHKHNGAVGDFTPSSGDLDFVPTFKTEIPFSCYNPVDLQVQRMSCEKPFSYPDHADVDLAVRNMKSAKFVGLVEAYHESLCLLSAKVDGKLSAGCNCENEDEWKTFSTTHATHYTVAANDTVKRKMTDFPEEVSNAIKDFTRGDLKLYEAAVARFVQDIDEVEKKHGVKVLCENTKKTLTRTTSL